MFVGEQKFIGFEMLSAAVRQTKEADANLGCSFSMISAMLVGGTAAFGEPRVNELGKASPPNTQIASAVIRYEPAALAALPRQYLQYLTGRLIADQTLDPLVSIPAWMTLINADGLAGRVVESLVSFPEPKSEGFNKIASVFETQWETGTSIPEIAVLQTGIPTGGKHIFVIPDLHGELRLLEGALGVIESQIELKSLNPKDVEIVCLGDYLNKGPDSYGVVSRLIEVSKEPPENSGFSGVSFNFLRGNHEDLEGIGFHLRSLGEECGDEGVEQYAESFVQAMEKGFAETVLSYLRSEYLSETEQKILKSFISDYSVIDSSEGRSWTKNGEIISEQDALSFFREFNRCWQDILTRSGHAEFFDSLKVGAKIGEWVFVHGGLPSGDEQIQQFSQQLQSPDAPHSETMITAACNANPLNSRELSEHQVTNMLPALNGRALIVGHSPGAGFGQYQTSDSRQAIVLGADSGAWRTGVLFVPYIQPDGAVSMLAVTERGTFPFHPSCLPLPGRKALPAK